MIEISIVVPVYNKEKYIYECIDSILSQTFNNFELILIDDGSPDNCGQICDEYSKKDDRIIVIHQQNKGHSCARNTGIHASKGKHLMFVDADDYLYDLDVLRVMVDDMMKNDSDIVIGEILSIGLDGEKTLTYSNVDIDFKQYNPITVLCLLMKHKKYFAVMCTNLYKRDLIVGNNLFFKEGLICDDEEWTPKVFYFAEKVSFVSHPCYVRRIVANSVTRISNERSIYKKAYDRVIVSNELLRFFSDKPLYASVRESIYAYCIGFYCSAVYTATFSLSNMEFVNSLIKHLKNNQEILKYSLKTKLLKYKIFYLLCLVIGINNIIKLYKFTSRSKIKNAIR
ncbi:MAG: glycosyltransferase [Candidatus Brocadiaceae bacterium]|nr:glycosyltransferase [Candidatus Brocadiaceae bacterium]